MRPICGVALLRYGVESISKERKVLRSCPAILFQIIDEFGIFIAGNGKQLCEYKSKDYKSALVQFVRDHEEYKKLVLAQA